jgi:hypothetical protein
LDGALHLMETQSLNIQIELLNEDSMKWFVETASVNMLTHELKRPELIDLDRIYGLALEGIKNKSAFVALKGDEYCGAIGGLLHDNLFNPKIKVLTEIFWYVLPEYRKSRAGILLLNAFDKRASEIADEATLSTLPSSVVNNKSLSKRGFNMSEFAFRKGY